MRDDGDDQVPPVFCSAVLTQSHCRGERQALTNSSNIVLQAADFNVNSLTWDNRATPGPVSFTNGDFAATGLSASYPAFQYINTVPAVVFTGTSTTSYQYMSSVPQFPLYAGLYGNSDWTYEAWLLHQGLYDTAAESTSNPQNPVFQWGLRNTSTCISAHFGMGSSPTDGAGGVSSLTRVARFICVMRRTHLQVHLRFCNRRDVALFASSLCLTHTISSTLPTVLVPCSTGVATITSARVPIRSSRRHLELGTPLRTVSGIILSSLSTAQFQVSILVTRQST